MSCARPRTVAPWRNAALAHTCTRFGDGCCARCGTCSHLCGPTTDDLGDLCPDWRERDAFCSGPRDLLDALEEHWDEHGDPERFHLERFQPIIGGNAGSGEGGTIHFLDSEKEVECDGGTPILVAGENAGLKLPYGCRIGICHTCVGTLKSGQLRDLRTDEVSEPTGAAVRTCIHTAEGDIEIEL